MGINGANLGIHVFYKILISKSTASEYRLVIDLNIVYNNLNEYACFIISYFFQSFA